MDLVKTLPIKPEPKTRKDYSYLGKIVVLTGGLLIFFLFFSLVLYCLIKGIPNLSWSLFALTYTSENVSMLPALINTFSLTLFTLLLAGPIGIFAAIYLVEYAGKAQGIVKIIRLATETLAGIPSIVYGLFGYLSFVVTLHLGYSQLAGIFTLSIMILPIIIRTTEESLLAVPVSFREASFALGAGKVRTIFKIILPTAFPGILGGLILSSGRIIGETAALIYTTGTLPEIVKTPLQSGRSLALHMYALLSEGLYTKQAYGTAVILLLVVIFLNSFAHFFLKKIRKEGTPHD